MADFGETVKIGAGFFFCILFAALFFHVVAVFLVDSGLFPWAVSHAVSFFRRIFRRKKAGH